MSVLLSTGSPRLGQSGRVAAGLGVRAVLFAAAVSGCAWPPGSSCLVFREES